MKRIVSVFLSLLLLCSTFTFVSARTVENLTQSVSNPMEMELAVQTLARKAGEGSYASSVDIYAANLAEGIGVDYKTTLNMQPVRRLFESGFMQMVVASDPQAKAEFDAGIVSTEVKVVITYPEKATVKANLQTAGVLDAGSIFSEKSRVVDSDNNTVTITYKNADSLTVAALLQNVESYLKNITFTLEDGLAYSENGYYTVAVALTGTTSIAFTSKTQKITYTGNASHVVSAGQTHVLEVVPVVPATCDVKGWTEGVRCKTHLSDDSGYGCGAYGIVRPTQTLDTLNHRLNGTVMTEKIAGVAPTCTAEGVLEHWVCLLCKKDFADQNATSPLEKHETVLAKTAHTRQEKAGVPATCTTDGLTAGVVCSVCGHGIEAQKRIPATGHTEATIPAVAPTCTVAGKTEGKKCSNPECGLVLVAQQPIAAKGHSFGAWETVEEAEEGKAGSKKRTCENCPAEETAVIPALVHVCKVDSKLSVVTKKPTCTQAGKMQEYCGCGKAVGVPKTVPATGHNVEKISGREASCAEKGILEHYACANCMGLFRDAACKNPIQSAELPVDRAAHKESDKRILTAVAPTCASDGLTEGEKCVACNIVTKAQEVIDKYHAFDDATGKPVYASFALVPNKSATCTEKGAVEHWHCAICNKDFAMDKVVTELSESEWTIAALGHSFGDVRITTQPTEVAEGEGVRGCVRCDAEKTVVIARKAHVHTEKVMEIVKAATCTEDGVQREIYSCCGKVVTGRENIRIPAKGHTLKQIEAVQPDCFHEGKKAHWYCTVCEKLFSSANGKHEVHDNELKIGKRTHQFVRDSENDILIINKCNHPGCTETVVVPKHGPAKVVEHGGIKDKADKTKEDRANENKTETKVEVQVFSQINIEEREISETLEAEVFEKEKASENKLVMDIVIEKVTIYSSTENDEELDRDKEIVPETEDLVIIELTIPENMRNLVDFVVHRLHAGQNGQTQTDIIRMAKNEDGEYIEISADKTKVTLHVKKFSEYALIGYNEVVNLPEEEFVSSGNKVSQFTVKFNTNGGTVVNSVKVKLGSTITPPETTRDGYKLEGWYTDIAMTKRFDFSTRISSNLTLYAKWVEADTCDGTEADNCPSLIFKDVDTSLWYHEGIDFVVENGYMIGVSKDAFAPDINLSRAMLVTTLWRMEGEPAAASASPFADVEPEGYYANAVAWAAENGIVTGYSEDTFGPHDLILREQMAAIMYRYAGFKGVDVGVYADTNILSYTDYTDVSEYAISALQYTVGSGLIKGRTASTLNPTATATRAETATILYRFVSMQK